MREKLSCGEKKERRGKGVQILRKRDAKGFWLRGKLEQSRPRKKD